MAKTPDVTTSASTAEGVDTETTVDGGALGGQVAVETDEADVEAEVDVPDPAYDPETQIMGADGEVKPMPKGEWAAATTPSGALKRSKGLLVEAG